MLTHVHFLDHIHRKVLKIAILGQMGPPFSPWWPPGVAAKVKKWTKVSSKVTFVRLCRSFGFKKQLNAPFRSKTVKRLYFPIVPIHFYTKYCKNTQSVFWPPCAPSQKLKSCMEFCFSIPLIPAKDGEGVLTWTLKWHDSQACASDRSNSDSFLEWGETWCDFVIPSECTLNAVICLLTSIFLTISIEKF